jgi:hypothetical protein
MSKTMTPEQHAQKKKRQAEWAKEKRKKLAAGKTPKAAKPKPEKAPKASKADEKKATDKNHAKKEDAVRKALKSGALDAREVADRIISRYDGLTKATANASNVGKRTAEEIKDAKGSFEAVIGETVGIEDNGAKSKKLDKVVTKYAELQAAISDGAEKRAKAKKAKKQAAERFDRAIEEAKQPSLPGLDDDSDD